MCPVCRAPLALTDGHRWVCGGGHSFDVARQGYVNLLVGGRRRGREAGDSREMVAARARFLATGAYDPLSDAFAAAVAAVADGAPVVLDVGCGEGRHTRAVAGALPPEALVVGVDVSKWAVAHAARAHPAGSYAVATAADLPLAPASVDVAVSVFGPVFAEELARVVRPGGAVVAAHPGRDHLAALRALVYAEPRPHDVKGPLRGAAEWFATAGSVTVTFPVAVPDARDLWAMTPYRWHAPPGIEERLSAPLETVADVVLTTYRRGRQP